ncbi:hypothetical protein BD408DRAFT_420495 [Parasitella parasitica]|nr:hypothetical protein BD408DRAFT_420495 [Parasitella parasitica]
MYCRYDTFMQQLCPLYTVPLSFSQMYIFFFYASCPLYIPQVMPLLIPHFKNYASNKYNESISKTSFWF